MKIAIDISQIAYEGTGVANYMRNLVIALVKNDKKNDYLFFGYSLRKKHLIDKFLTDIKSFNSRLDIRSFPLPQSAADFIWNRKHIFPLELLLGSVDIYHSSDWIQIPARAKKITTVHDLVIYKYPEYSAKRIIETQKRRMNRVSAECKIILADSVSTRNDLVEVLHLPQNSIKVVYPGVHEIFKKFSRNSVSKILSKYRIRRPYFLFIGANDPRKNLKRVVAVFKKLKYSVQLVIIGLSEKIASRSNIKVINNIVGSDLPALYSGASIFIYPSLYEGFGLPVIEAMKCGCPVITSNRGSLKEVSGNSAYIVDPESEEAIINALVKVWTDNILRKKLIKKGYQNANRFNWSTSAKKIIQIYEELYEK